MNKYLILALVVSSTFFLSCEPPTKPATKPDTKYLVNFNSQGGSLVEVVEVSSGSLLTKPADPTKTGNTFAGWYKESTFLSLWDFAQDKVLENTTLYAKWDEVIYTISFNSNGGSVVESINLSSGSLLTKPADPTKTGNTFAGWYKESTLLSLWDFSTDTVLESRTLYAKWDAITPPSTIKVGSFNISIFGPTKSSRENVLNTLAIIANKFDILAIQEVGSNNSTALESTCISVLNTFQTKINSIGGTGAFSYIRGNQYAIFYRNSKITLNQHSLYAGSQVFTYPPLVGNFKTVQGNLDFTILNIHVSPSMAATEIPALKIASQEYVSTYTENDVMILGDFNADGTYYDEGTGSSLSGFGSPYITVIPNTADTTVATSSNAYDRIQLTATMSEDYATTWGVYKFADYHDVSILEGATTTQGTEAALSDHYPVWAEFFSNQDSD